MINIFKKLNPRTTYMIAMPIIAVSLIVAWYFQKLHPYYLFSGLFGCIGMFIVAKVSPKI